MRLVAFGLLIQGSLQILQESIKKQESTRKCISFCVSQCHREMLWALENQDIPFFLVCLVPSPEQWLVWKSQGSGWMGPKRIKGNRVLELCLGIAELVVERFSGPYNATKLHRNGFIPLSPLPLSYAVTSTDQILQKLFRCMQIHFKGTVFCFIICL